MKKLGPQASITFPSVCFNKERDGNIATHICDFTVSGKRSDLIWLRSELEKEFELKSEMLGEASSDLKEPKLSRRTNSWTKEGLEYEGDKKACKAIIERMGARRLQEHQKKQHLKQSAKKTDNW